MRYLLAVCLACSGCSALLAPSYTCATQPRSYTSPAGLVSVEIDHYTSEVPCPIRPID